MKTKSNRKLLTVLIAALLVVSFLFAGCSNGENTGFGVFADYISDRLGAVNGDDGDSSVYDSLDQLKSPSSYEELYENIEKYSYKYTDDIYLYSNIDGGMLEDIAIEESTDAAAQIAAGSSTDAAAAPRSAAASGSAEKTMSDTNVRTEGVLESDVVKTDGDYIYALRTDTGKLSIVEADTLEEMYSGVILEDEFRSDVEMYVSDDRMYITCNGSYYQEKGFVSATYLMTFDITDREAPEKICEYYQDGYYMSARMAGNYLYLFTDYYKGSPDEDNFVPSFNGEKIEPHDIYYGRYFDSVNYYCIGVIDLNTPSVCSLKKAVLSGNSELYVSEDHIFLTSERYITNADRYGYVTDIVSFTYEDGQVAGRAIGEVSGYLNDSFSIDYYKDHLRMVVTVNEGQYIYSNALSRLMREYDDITSVNANSLYILDEDLNMVSSINNIEERETIKSARFLGDTLYFVTYLNTDPLFAVDLSDPENPVMLDGIQITGFSNYLHFYGDDLLLGIGYETDSNSMTEGIKLSMFDISDPGDLKEIHREVIKDAYSVGTDYSYKAVLVDPDKNLIGFATESYMERDPSDTDYYNYETFGTYHVYEYDSDEGFSELINETIYEYDDNYYYGYYIDYESDDTDEDGTAEPDEPQIPEEDMYMYYSISDVRGLYIDDYFYIVKPGFFVDKYSLLNYKKTDDIELY